MHKIVIILCFARKLLDRIGHMIKEFGHIYTNYPNGENYEQICSKSTRRRIR